MNYSDHLRKEGVAIFLFHGVIREQRFAVRNYTGKHLLRERFVSVLEDLHHHGTAVSLEEIVAAQRGKPLPERAFAVTFDDGFENNYSVAAPILSGLEIPATFYVTTGFIESNDSSWIDRIEYAVEGKGQFQLALPFREGGRRYATREEKVGLLEEIRRFVKNDPTVDPYAFAQDICRQLGVTAMAPEPDLDQKMSWDQIRVLSQNGLFLIGGHGHTHRILAYLDSKALEEEIVQSLTKLRRQLGSPVEHYSYPEGLSHCYSDRVIRLLRDHGIFCAVTAEEGINRPGDDLFRLKRIMVT